MNKISDFLVLLTYSLNSQKFTLINGEVGIMLEKIKFISEKNNLVIIEETIKNIKKNFLNKVFMSILPN